MHVCVSRDFAWHLSDASPPSSLWLFEWDGCLLAALVHMHKLWLFSCVLKLLYWALWKSLPNDIHALLDLKQFHRACTTEVFLRAYD